MAFVLPRYHAPDFTSPAMTEAPDARLLPAPADGVAPDGYHATSIYPEYFKLNGHWHLAAQSRMDCVAVLSDGNIRICEGRQLHQGDLVVVGRTERAEEGIYVHYSGFGMVHDVTEPSFAFRQGRSRETAFSQDYDFLYDLLRHEREQGFIVWVLGPACAFDADARRAMASLVRHGYVSALLAGNALAVHDLEGAWLRTALGQDIYTQQGVPNGHYHHLDTINRVRHHGSIAAFIREEGIRDGIIAGCLAARVSCVLVGSVRDDGPLPEVCPDVYDGQDAMRLYTRQATTVICLATTLHAIATGNMTPSYRVMPDQSVRPVYFYTVDISEFAVNKLSDRGSLSARGIVTNIQDFLVNICKGLGLEP